MVSLHCVGKQTICWVLSPASYQAFPPCAIISVRIIKQWVKVWYNYQCLPMIVEAEADCRSRSQ